MSPVFRHGRLRLYLLKLLDESPRHGYEVIRLLQDRFMGVYAPSPGTIYPRLARLEEEGLVTHDETDGRKVYRITDKGREELRNRSADLTDLEAEITASVRDIAREVTEDVRETVRNLREELTWAARDMQRRGGPPPGGSAGARDRAGRTPWQDRPGPWPGWDEARRAREEARRGRDTARQARAQARRQARSRPAAGPWAADSWAAAADDPADRLAAEQARLDQQQDRLNAEQARLDRERERVAAEQARLDRERERLGDGNGAAAERLDAERDRLGEQQDRLDEEQDRLDEEQDRLDAEHGRQEHSQGGPRSRGRARGGWDWQSWADWPGRRGRPHGPPPWADPAAFPDLEQLARHFTRELRDAAAHAHAVSEEAAGDLRSILDDALDRIKAEVFGAAGPRSSRPGDTRSQDPPPDQES